MKRLDNKAKTWGAMNWAPKKNVYWRDQCDIVAENVYEKKLMIKKIHFLAQIFGIVWCYMPSLLSPLIAQNWCYLIATKIRTLIELFQERGKKYCVWLNSNNLHLFRLFEAMGRANSNTERFANFLQLLRFSSSKK